jgi:uncharacterized protein (DUF305 family)
MSTNLKTVLISVGATLVVLALVGAAIWWFSPMRGLGPRMLGPDTSGGGMRGRGPMGFGMMREVHAMGDVDSEYGYLANMIPHHEEAIETARILQREADRTELREFADDIIEVQEREIDQMRSWLDEWYPDRPEEAEYEPMMRELEGLGGDRVGEAFLEDMIPHHMAAVMMSQQLLASDFERHPEVEDLARRIRDAQLREIRQMSDWLREWY